MEYQQLNAIKRKRLTHRIDLSEFSAPLINCINASCDNSRDPVRLVALSGNIFNEEGELVIYATAELTPQQSNYGFEYDEITIPLRANEFIKFEYIPAYKMKTAKYDCIKMDASLLNDQVGFYLDENFDIYPIAQKINFVFYTGITEGF